MLRRRRRIRRIYSYSSSSSSSSSPHFDRLCNAQKGTGSCEGSQARCEGSSEGDRLLRRVNLDRDEKPSLNATRCRSNQRGWGKRNKFKSLKNMSKQQALTKISRSTYGPPLPPSPQLRIDKTEIQKYSIAPPTKTQCQHTPWPLCPYFQTI